MPASHHFDRRNAEHVLMQSGAALAEVWSDVRSFDFDPLAGFDRVADVLSKPLGWNATHRLSKEELKVRVTASLVANPERCAPVQLCGASRPRFPILYSSRSDR